jgi:ornithine carbamoyltransferase
LKRDFLSFADWSKEELLDILALANEIKVRFKRGDDYRPLNGKTLAMIFQKPSARTRISFETGMYQLGGHAIYLSPDTIGMGNRESVGDVARTISRYNDIMMVRLFKHEDAVALAEYATIPIINGLTDLLHPCQILADAMTVIEYRKTFAVKVAFIGDGNNVANSWIEFASKIPIELVIGCPKGYEPNKEVLRRARKAGVSDITVTPDYRAAARYADVLYTDVWTSMGQEAETTKRKEIFKNYQINQELVDLAKKSCLVMHCLPAHRGEEITNDVIEGKHSVVFDEAENRLHVQKSILVTLLTS